MTWQEDIRRENKAKADFKAMCGKVAKLLDMRLDHDHDSWGARIISDDGRGYFLNFPHKGKTEISPLYPQSSFGFYNTERGRIGVTASRGAAVIAAEIKRRLEPVYRETLAKVQAYEADLAVDQGSRAVLSDKLASMFPAGTAREITHRQSEYQTELSISGPGLGGGTVQYSGGGGEVTIGANHGFRVPAGVATQMLAVYADYMRDEAEHRIARLGLAKVTPDAEQECGGRGRWCTIKAGQEAARDDDSGRVYCLAHLPEEKRQ